MIHQFNYKPLECFGDVIARFLQGKKDQNIHYNLTRKNCGQQIDWNELPVFKEVVHLKYRNLTLKTNKFHIEVTLLQRSSINAVRNRFLVQFHKQVNLFDKKDLLISSINKVSNKHFVIRFQISNLEQNYARLNLSRQLDIFSQKCQIFCG